MPMDLVPPAPKPSVHVLFEEARRAVLSGDTDRSIALLHDLQARMEGPGYHPSRPPANDGSSEQQYLDLVQDILTRGVFRPDRTGTGTYAIHGATMRYDLSDGTIPLLTTKKIPWKAVVRELIWFLNGETNIRPLVLAGVRIWSDWPYQKFLQATGSTATLREFEDMIARDAYFATTWGDLGPVYGKQWRRWQGPDGKIYDQISDMIEMIKTTPYSRRLLFHGWNVADIDKMALPPCHLLYQFFIDDGKLSCSLYQRSVDSGLGLPFNTNSVSFLVRMIAQQCDLLPGEVFWIGHDVHVYANHREALTEQLQRTPRPAPTLTLVGRPDNLFGYTIDNFEMTGYAPDAHIPMDVAV